MSIVREAAPLLREAMAPHLAAHLADPACEDLAVNGPGGFWVRARGGWTHHEEPRLDHGRLEGIGVLAGALRDQNVGKRSPILSTDIPGIGPAAHPLRLEVVLPPAVPHGSVTLCFRRPDDEVAPVEAIPERYDTRLWNKWKERTKRRRAASSALLDLYDAGDVVAFMRAVVRTRRNVLFCGPTGAGKTALGRTLTGSVDRHERVVTIEDSLEMVVPQPNAVRLLYSSGGLGGADLSPARLLKASLRLRPSRIIPQELRDPEAAFAYVSEGMTGHPGSLTTIHGDEPPQAARRLFNLAKGSDEGRSMSDETLADMLAAVVDVIVPVAVMEEGGGGRREMRELWFADERDRDGETFADLLRAR